MEHHGVDPARRRDVVREHVLAMRALWTDDEAEFHGEFVDFSPSWSWPKPVQPRRSAGADGRRAGTEAVRGTSPSTATAGCRSAAPACARRCPRCATACERFGRDPATVRLVPFGTLYDAGKVDYYASLGVEEIVLRVPEGPRDPVLAELDRLADARRVGRPN